MALIRWSPGLYSNTRDLVGIHDDVNRWFDGFFNRWPQRGDFTTLLSAPVDIEETPEEFVLHVDLPGVSQKDVKVSLRGDTLTIRGERKLESNPKNGNMHRSERAYGQFERSFVLGTPVQNDKVKATYHDGVLEVRVPKAEEARVREIEVQVA